MSYTLFSFRRCRHAVADDAADIYASSYAAITLVSFHFVYFHDFRYAIAFFAAAAFAITFHYAFAASSFRRIDSFDRDAFS